MDDKNLQILESFAGKKTPSSDPNTQILEDFSSNSDSGSILPGATPVTQAFGNENPDVEVMSGGVNNGTDFGASVGTPVNLPPGQWQVVDAYGADNQSGHIGDSNNSGYGNSVLVKNAKTGETLRFSHLSSERVQPGQVLSGGQIGQTGDTGNVTGPHLDLEYKNSQGNYEDILNSPYAKYIKTR